MLTIILVPVILVQLITVFIFYERHWDSVTRQMAGALAGEVGLIIDRAGPSLSSSELPHLREYAARYFAFSLQFRADEVIQADTTPYGSYADQVFSESLDRRINQNWVSDLISDPDLISVDVQLSNGVLRIYAGRKRIFSSTSWTFLAFTIGSSLFLFVISLVFLRGQVRPIRRLADAARQLGLGRSEVDYQLEGAREVRLAGRAFQAMRYRIMRQLNERTEMLAGVSHDLRTPLTRMRFQLALMTNNEDTKAISSDISEMEEMIDGYLAFAAGEGNETPQELAVDELLSRLVTQAHKSHKFDITLSPVKDEIPAFPMRRNAIQRAFSNIISNAIRYSTKTIVAIRIRNDEVIITFDDNGAGIPQERRADAIRPFIRLEESRNRRTGGAGLGLSITSDVILNHGGELTLGDSPLGGLRVAIKLPV